MAEPMDVPEWVANLPRRYVGSGCLLTNAVGDVLLVKPTYNVGWEIPGGVVEREETPPVACRREVREELGCDLDIGRLLVIEHQWQANRGDSIMFVYDAGTLPGSVTVSLPRDELSAWAFVSPDGLDAYTAPWLAGRLRAALLARATGVVVELENRVAR